MITRRNLIGCGLATMIAGEVNSYPVKSMVSTKGSIESYLTDEHYKQILFGMIEGTLSDIEIPGLKSVGNGCIFYGANQITSLSLPDCETAGTFAFRGMTRCVEFNLPKLRSVLTNGFTGCVAPILDLPMMETIGQNCFQSAQTITLKIPNVTSIASSGLHSTSSFRDVFLTNKKFGTVQNFPWGVTNTSTVFHFSDGDYNKDGEKV